MQIKIFGHGKMGKAIREIIEEDCSLKETDKSADVVLDASHRDNLDFVLSFAMDHQIPIVIATTNYTPEDLLKINEASKQIPILKASNFSMGVAVLNKLVQIATPVLKDSWDIEIIEKHHNQKADAPSGTALTLFDSVNESGEFQMVQQHKGRRKSNEVGILSLRGGTISGEHCVQYCGTDETIELTHRAGSRKIFASGMLKSAEYLQDKSAGMYTFDDVLFTDQCINNLNI